MDAPKKVRMVCSDCGSEEVRRDAWSEWDEEEQEWVLHSVYDNAFCEDCEGECSIAEVEIGSDDEESAP